MGAEPTVFWVSPGEKSGKQIGATRQRSVSDYSWLSDCQEFPLMCLLLVSNQGGGEQENHPQALISEKKSYRLNTT